MNFDMQAALERVGGDEEILKEIALAGMETVFGALEEAISGVVEALSNL